MLNQIIHILQLPEKCLVNKKITKAFFKRNFDLTNAEKNLLDDYSAVVAIDWIASISSANANVPAWQNAEYSFEEIQVLLVSTSPAHFNSMAMRIIDLVQKNIPYHLLLVVHDGVNTIWNVCYKRINLNDNNKRTIDKKFTTDAISLTTTNEIQLAFIKAINFNHLTSTDLKVLYDGYVQCFVGLYTAPILGSFEAQPIERTKAHVEQMERIASLEKEITTLYNTAQKETQLNKKIELNTQIQQKRQQIQQLKNTITAA